MARQKKKKKSPPALPPAQPELVEKSPAELQAELVEKYSEFLDESLIILIFNEQGFEKADKALASLAENVFAEEATGFDSSGLQGIAAIDETHDTSGASSYHTTAEDPSPPSQVTSVFGNGSGSMSDSQSTPLSPDSGALDDWRAVANDLPADGTSTLTVLRDAFPTVKESDIRKALKESGDDVDRASDVLLNLEHLIETGQRPKGIDAFAVDDVAAEWNQNKKSKKRDANFAWPKNSHEKRLHVNYKLTPAGFDGVYEIDDGKTAAPKRGSSKPFWDTTARERRQGDDERALYDKIVDEQSKGDNIVDLHNVPVKHGIHIALERTRYWWAHLGEDRIRKAQDHPFRIVTGIGLHSPEGYSRMYSDVERALKNEGWKFNDGYGYYDIRGKTAKERAS
ncbi:smr domain containing protein [Sporothrix brasiliensis 5110]|uniref:Smr domain containing protein n=1 Tax=Sporothrix brasiliensis 5110 TaxID=1398154 RepID=A0A0C2EUN0_9PEZI|nr:smr domain containing protein [Sporothrix brasiliensis 5110]KIH90259.1 smr domain containing protein [Sporothrix brasiliensis 5110]